MYAWRYILAFVLLVCSAPAVAQVAECDSALIIATYSELDSSKSDWRMAKHINEATYNEIKHDASATGAIYGVPVGASYGDFQKNISDYSNSQSESLTREQFRNISWTGLDPSAAHAYQACIKGKSRGLALIPERATDSDITFRVSYSPVGGSANPLPVAWFGAEAAGNSLPNSVSSGETIIILKRPDKTSTLAVNSSDTSGFSDSVVLTPLPKEEAGQRFAARCNIVQTPNPGAITHDQSFSWICPRVRAGTYVATLLVEPGADRPVRVSWNGTLSLKSDSGTKVVPLAASSGSIIDVGVNAGIGTRFESHGNIIDVAEMGALPVFTVYVTGTAWHGDFSRPSDDPIRIPVNVNISMERQ